MNDRAIIASELFDGGLYCSQTVLGAFCEKYDMDKATAFKISCGLNSGVRCAEICGAVLGAILVVGLKYGGSPDICNLKTEEFIKNFKDKNGNLVCRNILGHDISTPDGKKEAAKGNLFKTVCRDMVVSAARILEDSGY